MFVTCYYDIYNNPDKFIEYLSLFHSLGTSNIPIILFTEPHLVDIFKIYPIKVIGIPLETFELYSIALSYKGELPTIRTSSKDTKEYLALMNTKIEFILRASEISDDDTFIWIDFGILKICQNPELFINKLKSINKKSFNTQLFNKIVIPGCWEFGSSFSVDIVNWRFCGGILIIPRKYIQEFYQHSKNVLNDFCTLPIYKLTWELNVWNIIETYAMKDDILWYLADHNDSIIHNIDTVINQ